MTDGSTLPRFPHTFLGLSGQEAGLDAARFVVVPIPWDGTTVHGRGAAQGPEAIIRASRDLELYDEELSFEAWQRGIHTAKPLSPLATGPQVMVEQIKRATQHVLGLGKLPVILGGDHSISAPAIEACLESASPRLTVLQIDAHANMLESADGSAQSHASVMRGVSDRVRLIQVGIRACSEAESALFNQGTVTTHLMHAMRRRPFGDALAEISDSIHKATYISIDVDAFDPSVMPSTARPEPGGLLWWEMLALLRSVISRASVVGFEVVGLSPLPGMSAPDRLVACLVYKIIGYIARYQALWSPDSETTGPQAPPPPPTAPQPTSPLDDDPTKRV